MILISIILCSAIYIYTLLYIVYINIKNTNMVSKMNSSLKEVLKYNKHLKNKVNELEKRIEELEKSEEDPDWDNIYQEKIDSEWQLNQI